LTTASFLFQYGRETFFWQTFGISDRFFQGYFWTPLTSIFVHLSWSHLLMNMVLLAVLGVYVKRFMSDEAFLFAYLLSGVVGALFAVYWSPDTITVGASGALYGLAVAAMMLLASNGLPYWPFFIWLALNLWASISSGASWQAHVGGVFGGVLSTLILLASGQVRDPAQQRTKQMLQAQAQTTRRSGHLVAPLPQPSRPNRQVERPERPAEKDSHHAQL